MKGQLLITSLLFIGSLLAQDSMLFKPDYKSGKDAYLRSLTPDDNYGTHTYFAANAWTNGVREVLIRGVIDFELYTLPSNIEITGAYLSLYSYDSNNGRHSNRSVSNEAVLKRIVEPWEEGLVTWNNQPAVTDENQVLLNQSTAEDQDYLDIDVTELVKDMHANPQR